MTTQVKFSKYSDVANVFVTKISFSKCNSVVSLLNKELLDLVWIQFGFISIEFFL